MKRDASRVASFRDIIPYALPLRCVRCKFPPAVIDQPDDAAPMDDRV